MYAVAVDTQDIAGYDFQPRQGFAAYENQYQALGIGQNEELVEVEGKFSKKFKKFGKKVNRFQKKLVKGVKPLLPVAGAIFGGPVGAMVGGVLGGAKVKASPVDFASPGIVPETFQSQGGSMEALSVPGSSNGLQNNFPGGEPSGETRQEAGSKFMPLLMLGAAAFLVYHVSKR